MSEKRVVEAIRAHMRNPRNKLTKEQERLWKCIDHAWALLVDTKSMRTDVEKVDALRHLYNIGQRTAYEWLSWAKELYGDVMEGNKAAHRAIVYQYAQETFRKAALTNNAGAMASAVAQMVKILGLDREEPDTPDFGNIQPPPIILTLPAEAQKQLMILSNAGVIDLNSKPNVEDAEYEELPPADPRDNRRAAQTKQG